MTKDPTLDEQEPQGSDRVLREDREVGRAQRPLPQPPGRIKLRVLKWKGFESAKLTSDAPAQGCPVGSLGYTSLEDELERWRVGNQPILCPGQTAPPIVLYPDRATNEMEIIDWQYQYDTIAQVHYLLMTYTE